MPAEAKTGSRSASSQNFSQGLFHKATAIAMSAVLAVGLCPIANPDRAWADGATGETIVETEPGTSDASDTTAETNTSDMSDTSDETSTTDTTGTTDSAGETAASGVTDADSLRAAVASGGTVTLAADIDLGSTTLAVPANATVTLDLNDHVLKSTETVISNAGTLTVKDSGTGGAIVSTGYQGIQSLDSSTTNFEGGTIESVEGAIMPVKNSHVNISGGTLKASDNAVVIMNGSANGKYAGNTVNITGGSFIGAIKTAGYVACGVYAPNADTVNISGGTFDIAGGAGVVARAGNVNLSGNVVINTTGSVTGKVGDSRVVVPCSAIVFDSQASYPALADSSAISVTGGTFTSADGVDAISCIGEKNRVAVSDGAFSSDPSGYLVRSLTASKGEGSELYTVDAPAALLVSGEAEVAYGTVAAAIEAAQNGDTVKLAADATDNVEIAAGKAVTIDLNGKVLTAAAKADTISNHGQLAIADTATGDVGGKVENNFSGCAALMNYPDGTATVNGGTLAKADGQWYVVKNLGSLSFPEGTAASVTTTDAKSSLIDNGWYNGAAATAHANDKQAHASGQVATLVIAGGSFEGGLNTVKNDDFGKLEMTGGTIANNTQAGILNWNDATISGGSIAVEAQGAYGILNGASQAKASDMDTGNLIVNGPVSVTAPTPIKNNITDNVVKVTAGTYSAEVPADLIPAGYQCTGENGTWKVSVVPAVKAVRDAIDSLGETPSVSSVREASAAYSALTPELKTAVSDQQLARLNAAVQAADQADKQAADAAAALIEAADAATPASVEAARAAYEALSDDQKELVPEEVLLALQAAEAQVAANEQAAAEQAAREANKQAADNAAALIGAADASNPESVAAARAAYEALNANQKALVPAEALLALQAAEAQVVTNAQAAAKRTADKAVADSVIELAAKMDATSVVAVKAARSAYEALTVDQKALVPADALKKITDAEAALANPKTKAKISDIALSSGVIVDAKVASAKSKTLSITGSSVSTGAKVALNTAKIVGSTYKVASVAANAFKGTKAAQVTLGSNVKTVGSSAFANASALSKVTVGDNVTKLGSKAFAGDKALTTLTLGKKVKTIGSGALNGCSKLTKVTVKSSKLTKTSFKNLLKGSKVKTVKLKGVSKAAKAKYKKWAPKGVTVK